MILIEKNVYKVVGEKRVRWKHKFESDVVQKAEKIYKYFFRPMPTRHQGKIHPSVMKKSIAQGVVVESYIKQFEKFDDYLNCEIFSEDNCIDNDDKCLKKFFLNFNKQKNYIFMLEHKKGYYDKYFYDSYRDCIKHIKTLKYLDLLEDFLSQHYTFDFIKKYQEQEKLEDMIKNKNYKIEPKKRLLL